MAWLSSIEFMGVPFKSMCDVEIALSFDCGHPPIFGFPTARRSAGLVFHACLVSSLAVHGKVRGFGLAWAVGVFHGVLMVPCAAACIHHNV